MSSPDMLFLWLLHKFLERFPIPSAFLSQYVGCTNTLGFSYGKEGGGEL